MINLKIRNHRSTNVLVYTQSKELYGYTKSYESIGRLVASLDAKSVITSLAKACWLLETQGDNDEKCQLKLASTFLEGKALRNAIDLITNEGRTVFFRNQIYILMKYVAQYSKKTGASVAEDELHIIGGALITITDLLASVHKEQQRLYERQSSSQTTNQIEKLNQLAYELIANSFLFRSLRVPSTRHSLSRTRIMYVDIHKSLRAEELPNFMDIERYFSEATGVELNAYLSIGIAMIVHFLQLRVDQDGLPIDMDFILLNPHKIFGNSTIEFSIVEKVLESISLTIQELREYSENQNKRERTYDFLKMRARPLIKIENGIFIPISVSYVIERFATGVYWTVLDHINRNYSLRLSNQFTSYNGILFQKYVERTLEQLRSRTSPPNEVILFDRPYRIGKEEYRTPDVILLGDNYAILVEASATRIQAKKTESQGIPQAFRDDCQKMIFHNAKSLDFFIRNLLEGKVQLEGFDLSRVKEIYPIIVTIEGFPNHPGLDVFLQNEINREGWLSQKTISGLSVLDIRDLEHLEAYCLSSFISVLRAWHKNSPYLLPITNLSTFLESSDFLSGRALSTWSSKIVDQAFEESTMLIFGKPLFAEASSSVDMDGSDA